ncbi:hypothetical protein J1N35_039244 [Gossypium stocksii]|uniref:Uncharacterized protein n=1 Tax=Gossypium stocksii TaxID=47602 RepID=A0A9D3UNH0_9ROSI|nr:hypothetical protein J1N35_039244 [Gossypium stocksii]
MFSVFVFWVYLVYLFIFYNNDLNCYNGGEIQERNFLPLPSNFSHQIGRDTKNSQMGFQIPTSLMEQSNRSLRFEPFETRGANGIVVAGGAACDGKFGFLGVEKKGLSLNLSGENDSSKTLVVVVVVVVVVSKMDTLSFVAEVIYNASTHFLQ